MGAVRSPAGPSSGRVALKGGIDGSRYEFGETIGVGGEGEVRAVEGHRGLVAKTYLYPLTRDKQDKIQELVRGAQPSLLAVAAWPTETLCDGHGRVAGFIMPKVEGALGLHELFSPRSRVRIFPTADFRFLVHVAANIARLFATVHAGGYVIGDVNQNNILVRLDGTVAAIDVDSFQIGDGRRFGCNVATELFLPPELRGVELGAVPRTPDNDAYGLAVLLFQILFMGRHPFAGRYLGRGEMPIERAMAESRFAYSAQEKRTRMAPPPHTPPLASVGGAADLFERAFAPPHGRRPRPTPAEWLSALHGLRSQLKACEAVAWHHHARGLTACPWCTIEQAAKVKLFGGVVPRPKKVMADLATLWSRVEATPLPRPIPAVPTEAEWVPARYGGPARWIPHLPLGLAFAIGTPAAILAALSSAVEPGLIVLGTGVLTAVAAAVPWEGEVAGRPSPLDVATAQRQFDDTLAVLKSLRPDAVVAAQQRKLARLKEEIDALGAISPATVATEAKSEAEQREEYLARQVIEQAKLFNIGPARCAVLRSWGIETACDVDEAKLDEIPGFGRNLRDRLVNWKEGLERTFVYVPPALVQQPRERAEVDREISVRQIRLMAELRAESESFLKLVGEVNREREDVGGKLTAAFDVMMRARGKRGLRWRSWGRIQR